MPTIQLYYYSIVQPNAAFCLLFHSLTQFHQG